MSWRDVLNPYAGQKTLEERRAAEREIKRKEVARPKPTAEERKRANCDRRIALARSFCDEVKEIPTVSDCIVDDWTEYCDNFQVFVSYDMSPFEDISRTYYRPKDEGNWNLGSVTRGIKKVAKGLSGVSIGRLTQPKKKYSSDRWGKKELGYDEPRADIDLWIN